jgi:hypothetical protein
VAAAEDGVVVGWVHRIVFFHLESAAVAMSLVGVGRYRTDRGDVGELGFSPLSFFFCPLVYWLLNDSTVVEWLVSRCLIAASYLILEGSVSSDQTKVFVFYSLS